MSTPSGQPFRIAAVQAAPIFLDLRATIDKACRLIETAAKEGASLVAFPEAFVPAYPFWIWHIPAGRTHPLRALYAELLRNSVVAGDDALRRLGEAASDNRIAVAMGVNERNAEGSNSSLYNAIAWFGPDGRFFGMHRKLVPTAGERLVYAQSPGNDLQVFDLPFGRVSGLVCWENYMPLARYSLSAWGEQIHVAPTWDRGEPWTSTMRHIAKESRCFVLGVCQALHLDDIPDRLDFKREYLTGAEGWLNPGASVIVDPDGRIVAGPLEAQEGILFADVHPDQLTGPRWQLDIGGHYARPDLFTLSVNRSRRGFLEPGHADNPREVGERSLTGGHPHPETGLSSLSMQSTSMQSTTTLTRDLQASPSAVFAALTDARDVMTWMVPEGMTGQVHEFDVREGGRFRITLRYDEPTGTGKTADNSDTYHGRFVRLVPGRLVEQELEFETDDPSMQGVMRIVLELEGVASGTRLTARHEELPPGLSPSDNEIGWSTSLGKLEKLLAGR